MTKDSFIQNPPVVEFLSMSRSRPNCPSCQCDLTKKETSSKTFLECSLCKGILISTTLCHSLFDANLISEIWRSQAIQSELRCPLCRHNMDKVSPHFISSAPNKCPNCMLFWFKKNEVQQLLNRHQTTQTAQNESSHSASSNVQTSDRLRLDAMDTLKKMSTYQRPDDRYVMDDTINVLKKITSTRTSAVVHLIYTIISVIIFIILTLKHR